MDRKLDWGQRLGEADKSGQWTACTWLVCVSIKQNTPQTQTLPPPHMSTRVHTHVHTLTIFSPSPIHLLVSDDAEIEKNCVRVCVCVVDFTVCLDASDGVLDSCSAHPEACR